MTSLRARKNLPPPRRPPTGPVPVGGPVAGGGRRGGELSVRIPRPPPPPSRRSGPRRGDRLP
jgi:hypothetical protein